METKQEILDEFVEWMPRVRKRLGLSQTELGQKIGLSRQSISSIERKQVPLTWDTFLAISLVILVNDPDVFKEFEHPERFLDVVESLKTGT
jgi:DNA-binding XRE family transcriptional regulator